MLIDKYFKSKLLDGHDLTESNPAIIHNIMHDKFLLQFYLMSCKISSKTNVYDYMMFLRKERARILSNCRYKVKRRKTPSYQHSFSNMKLCDFILKYKKDINECTTLN